MAKFLKIAVWNANGLAQHIQHIKIFLLKQDIDIMLISETHFTKKSYFKIPKYVIYDTQHPDGTAHGGTAVIIKNTIKHHIVEEYKQNHLQATSISVEEWNGPIIIASIYCPPKYAIKKEMFQQFYDTLGPRFIAGGDYNAKHTHWGSRLITPKGRELLKTMDANNLDYISTGEPTYWPTDPARLPDVIDFCITKGIPKSRFKVESCLDLLSSDHTPIIVTLSTQIITIEKPLSLTNKSTNWQKFCEFLDETLILDIPLKTNLDIDKATEHLTQSIQQAAWYSTPEPKTIEPISYNCPALVKQKIDEKRKLRKVWQRTRAPQDKSTLNKTIKELKHLLETNSNMAIQNYLQNLSATKSSDYSLWKATRRLNKSQEVNPPIRKKDGSWARSNIEKANLFAEHLADVFKPFESEVPSEEEAKVHEYLDSPDQLEIPIKPFKITEVRKMINKNLNSKKSPGYDLITGEIIKKLPNASIRYITQLFNAILRLEYFPMQWKVAQIILIPKPGKSPNNLTSYRPISLLPTLSKLLEKMILKRLLPIIEERCLIPNHQFGFRQQHSTIEQVHRVANTIYKALETENYCAAAFLDVSQAFDKVWIAGLLYKLKKFLPHNLYRLIKSYLLERHYLVKHRDEHTSLFPINSGVPQGSVLGPILYILHTADLPTMKNTVTATFADDTTLLAIHQNPTIASEMLQRHLDEIQKWLKKWRIKVNETKSAQVTFAMGKKTCPPVYLNKKQLPQEDDAKYLGIHLDKRLTWGKHILTKRKQLGRKLTKYSWLMGKKSRLSHENKLLIYKSILKPVWTYGIQLWGSASKSNIEILQRFQSKVLRMIVDAPWYVPNELIQRDLQIKSVQEEITNYSKNYFDRLSAHPNTLAVELTKDSKVHRLKKFRPSDLTSRFKL